MTTTHLPVSFQVITPSVLVPQVLVQIITGVGVVAIPA